MADESKGIVIVVDLPQPISRISRLLEAISDIFPGTQVNFKPDEKAAELGNWLVHIEANEAR